MLTLIRWLLARYKREKAPDPREEVAAFLGFLRQVSVDERGGALAGAMLARKTLDTTRLIEMPFPADILDSHLPLDSAALERLTAYLKELKRFKRICMAEGSILTTAVARGLDIWIISLWCLTLPAMAEGCALWELLASGDAQVEAAYRFMVRRELTDLERGYLTYRPAIFAAS